MSRFFMVHCVKTHGECRLANVLAEFGTVYSTLKTNAHQIVPWKKRARKNCRWL